MDSMEKLKEKLKLYLSTLSESAQKMLLRNLEKAQREGNSDAAAELIVAALRDLLRIEEKIVPLEEFAKKDFFREARFFTSEIDLLSKVEARISPTSFDVIWSWIKRDIVAPEHLQKLAMDCTDLEKHEISKHSAEICADLVAAIKARLKVVSRELGGEQKLTNHLGGEIVYKDLLDVLVSAERLMPLKPILSRMPKEVASWSSPEGDEAYKLISRYVQQAPLRTSWLFSAVSKKLLSPRLRIQLATKLSGSDDAIQVAATVYAPAIQHMLAEMDAHVAEVDKHLKEFSGLHKALDHLRSWSVLAKAVEVELEVPNQSLWGGALTEMRKKMSRILKSEVESAPGLVRKALRAPKSGEPEAVDSDLIIDAVRASQIFHQAELAKDSLAMNGPIAEARKELDQSFEILTKSLVDRTRRAVGVDVEVIEKLHVAALDIAKNLFDTEFADSLGRQLKAAASVTELQVAEA
ncbi:hypothetical protein [uncultured Cohaesibacter sp.]|uniref:hypothetical protein n=1 Tax=uncultured Cohaesibacter sp. TaxID=1002546 RepID=UPI002AABB019|nr:hypothetical protein [uncultured Cohaesibacter sp.]